MILADSICTKSSLMVRNTQAKHLLELSSSVPITCNPSLGAQNAFRIYKMAVKSTQSSTESSCKVICSPIKLSEG